ncbi:MAG: hypothetical protein ACR2Q3_00285 [Woeseiaceae bacterium]
MRQQLKLLSLCAVTIALVCVSPAFALNVNKSVKLADGAQSDGASTVNGSITIGKDATITGAVETVNGTIRIDEGTRLEDAETVNGSIRIASGVTAEDITSVNGAIRLDENVTVDGEVSVVNGKITLDKGTSVADDVSNVNGEISVVGAEIGGDLATVNGNVTLTDNSTLRGNLIVEEPKGWSWGKKRRKPVIIIGPNSTIAGDIRLEREVELFISESAEVGGVKGELSMDDAVRFSGARP